MELRSIFVDERTLRGLYSICLTKGAVSEFDLLMSRLQNLVYIRRYCKENMHYLNTGFWGKMTLEQLISEIDDDVWKMTGRIREAARVDPATGKNSLESIFRPLYPNDYVLEDLQQSKHKPSKKSKVRVYAIRLSAETFVVTGGAIKLTHQMQDHPDTDAEEKKIGQVVRWLESKDIFDEDMLIYYYEHEEE